MSDKIIVAQTSKLKTIFMVLGFISVIVVLGILIWFAKSMYDENLKLRSEMVAQKRLTETLIRSSTKWATKKDLKASLGDMLTKKDRLALEKDLKALNAKLVAVGKTVGSVKEKIASLEKSDKEGKENKIEK